MSVSSYLCFEFKLKLSLLGLHIWLIFFGVSLYWLSFLQRLWLQFNRIVLLLFCHLLIDLWNIYWDLCYLIISSCNFSN